MKLQARIQEAINHLVLDAKQTSELPCDFKLQLPIDFWYVDLKSTVKSQFTVPDSEKVIKILRLGLSYGVALDGQITGRDFFVYFLFQDNTSQVLFNVNASHLFDLIKKPIRKFRSQGAIGAFSDRVPVRIDWEKQSVLDTYQFNVHAHYIDAHNKLIKYLFEKIITSPKPLLVVDAGCGIGKLAKILNFSCSEHKEVSGLISYLGYDFNQENIESCEAKLGENGINAHFLKDEHKNIDGIVEKFGNNRDIVVIFSGSLTRNVVKNGFVSLEILQKTALAGVKYITGGGYQQPLITSFIARKLGYKSVWVPEKNDELFLYKRLSDNMAVMSKTRKLENQGILDLSLSYRPEYFLDALNHLISDGIILDLSFCVVSEALFAKLEKLLTEKSIKIIFWHFSYQAITQFQDSFGPLTQYGHKTEILLVEDDSYLLAPRKFFTSIQTKNPAVIETKIFMDEKKCSPERRKTKVGQALSERTKMDSPLLKSHALQYLSEIEEKQSFRGKVIGNIITIASDLSANDLFDFIKFDRFRQEFNFPHYSEAVLVFFNMKVQEIKQRLAAKALSADTLRAEMANFFAIVNSCAIISLYCHKIQNIRSNYADNKMGNRISMSLLKNVALESKENGLQSCVFFIESSYNHLDKLHKFYQKLGGVNQFNLEGRDDCFLYLENELKGHFDTFLYNSNNDRDLLMVSNPKCDDLNQRIDIFSRLDSIALNEYLTEQSEESKLLKAKISNAYLTLIKDKLAALALIEGLEKEYASYTLGRKLILELEEPSRSIFLLDDFSEEPQLRVDESPASDQLATPSLSALVQLSALNSSSNSQATSLASSSTSSLSSYSLSRL